MPLSYFFSSYCFRLSDEFFFFDFIGIIATGNLVGDGEAQQPNDGLHSVAKSYMEVPGKILSLSFLVSLPSVRKATRTQNLKGKEVTIKAFLLLEEKNLGKLIVLKGRNNKEVLSFNIEV